MSLSVWKARRGADHIPTALHGDATPLPVAVVKRTSLDRSALGTVTRPSGVTVHRSHRTSRTRHV